ncbi:MAG: CDP-alcohol phosphatidyltransferase family protein [Zetaproteobacteria bacterium]|nr:CDP-alcohol phosphatidyltransferase family protein [Zetaproteobacteria bacterium]
MQKILNIPNILTLLRIVLTPMIVYALLNGNAALALTLMIIAGISDMLDGAIARYFNQRTTVGAYLDPFADKLMLVSMFVTLFFMEKIPMFIFLAVVFRDAVIVFGALAYEMVTKSLKMEPSIISKITTFMQISYVLLILIHMMGMIDQYWIIIATWSTFIVTCASGIHYMIEWTRKATHHEQM